MIIRRIAVLLALFVPLASCVTGTNTSTPGVFQAKFAPLFDILPFPNDIYFNHSDGSANTTGTLSILPIGSSTTGPNAPLAALDHLDGFGTQSDIDIYFNQSVDVTTVAANVVVLKVASDPLTKAVNPLGTVTPLVPGTDYSIGLSAANDDGGQTVVIKPLKPLAASTVVGVTPTPATYLVIVKGGLKDTNGDAVTASSDFATVIAADTPNGTLATSVGQIQLPAGANPALLPVAQFTLPQLLVAAGAGVTPNNVALTFSFSTAYLGLTLAELSAGATATTQPAGVGIVDTGNTVCAVLVASGQLPSAAACAAVPGSTATEVFAGTVAIPYYLKVPTMGNPTAALTDYWQTAAGGDTTVLNPLPAQTVPQNVIPILVALPKSGGPCTNGPSWPTVIFQHGITRNREDMLGIASTLVMGGAPSFCTAVVAIDLPLHGVTNKSDPFYVPGHERTFDMDLENNTTLAAGPDGNIDTSGAWFINLTSTITSRDNLREGAADLINLTATLPNLTAGTNTFNSAAVFFVGHSLGGIVGTDFLGADTAGHALGGPLRIKGAVLANPGGHISELLRNSPAFGPVIDGQLAVNGLAKGTLGYYAFYNEAQAAAEDGDPGNYAALASGGHLVHMLEVVGGLDTGSPPDQVVPNSATDVLIGQMGITTTVSTVGPHAIAVGAPTLAQFTSGDHGSVLSPAAPSGAASADVTAYAAVTTEMQTEIIKLFGSIAAGTPATIVTSNTYLSATLQK